MMKIRTGMKRDPLPHEIFNMIHKKYQQRYGRVRGWMDRRLQDSYLKEVKKKLIKVALHRMEADARRPDMIEMAGKIWKQLIEAKAWDERVKVLNN